jgi:hypothetical protein
MRMRFGATGGVFTGPGPVADRVIATGNPLFGSTLSAIDTMLSVGLNDGGSMAFAYSLANVAQGIALAVPVVSEPAGPALFAEEALAVAGAARLGRRFKRRRRAYRA